MSKNHNFEKISSETKTEAIKTAKATQRPGQAKEQTKLIAQGIEKGIHQYKKQQKAKSREYNKKVQKASSQKPTSVESKSPTEQNNTSLLTRDKVGSCQTTLPWILLALSWVGFVAYFIVTNQIQITF